MGGNLPSHVPSDSVVGHRTPSHISSEGGVVVAGNPHLEQGRGCVGRKPLRLAFRAREEW